MDRSTTMLLHNTHHLLCFMQTEHLQIVYNPPMNAATFLYLISQHTIKSYCCYRYVHSRGPLLRKVSLKVCVLSRGICSIGAYIYPVTSYVELESIDLTK